jgi:hypothetical protein
VHLYYISGWDTACGETKRQAPYRHIPFTLTIQKHEKKTRNLKFILGFTLSTDKQGKIQNSVEIWQVLFWAQPIHLVSPPEGNTRRTKHITYDSYFIFRCNLNDCTSVLQWPAVSFTLWTTSLHIAIYCCLPFISWTKRNTEALQCQKYHIIFSKTKVTMQNPFQCYVSYLKRNEYCNPVLSTKTLW